MGTMLYKIQGVGVGTMYEIQGIGVGIMSI